MARQTTFWPCRIVNRRATRILRETDTVRFVRGDPYIGDRRLYPGRLVDRLFDDQSADHGKGARPGDRRRGISAAAFAALIRIS